MIVLTSYDYRRGSDVAYHAVANIHSLLLLYSGLKIISIIEHYSYWNAFYFNWYWYC